MSTKVDYMAILPVLFLEYLCLGLARSLIPSMIVEEFGIYSYIAVGIMETIKGLLAFVSSPLFGKLSDIIGRKYCLLTTVIGTTMPILLMVFSTNMYLYAATVSISGFFSATFALTFAYISDCVENKQKRAPAYGLALATFGLSFTIGPTMGSYIAEQFSTQAVFLLALFLVVLNTVYVVFKLPETAPGVEGSIHNASFHGNLPNDIAKYRQSNTNPLKSQHSSMGSSDYYQKFGVAMEYLPNSWNFSETFQIFSADPFMWNLAVIVFIYYTAVWAIVSTLMVYITRHLRFSPVQLGWLLSAYGLATMFSEGILVRIVVPRVGEINAMRLGLLAFSIQCALVAVSTSAGWIFVSVLFSMGANLFYPAVSSLVSKVCDDRNQGEALGALNGIKALTEGFGPLFFGLLMGLFEESPQPGAPFLLASIFSLWAFLHCFELPVPGYLLEQKQRGAFFGTSESRGLLDGEVSNVAAAGSDSDDYDD
mmetsp:Transcript_7161/g.12034  ORF Transcript_7161/g.12034 Transcript_7161/m.12034 type:complete len:481 (+) Transcript_7161:267-1709(+)